MTPAFLLWLLALNAMLKPSESHGHGFEDVKDYEVVRPVRLHSVKKRHTESIRPQKIKYAMTVGGRSIEMQLERNEQLLTKDYTETSYATDGTLVTTSPKDIDPCYYQGSIKNDRQSSASISTCDGLRGYFRTSAQKYLIEPLTDDDEGDHAVMTFNETSFTPAVCGVTNTSWSSELEPPTSRSRSRSAGVSILQQQKYIELFLVADNREYKKMDRDQTKLRKRIFEIVNFVNMAYKPLRTFIALVGLEIWSSGDLIKVTPPAGANLEAFMKWRNSALVKRKKHDNAHLVSGIDFEGATVGLAFIGTLCSGHSVGVIQDHNNRAIAVGATLAHEMGHNLGMDHDDSSGCTCSGESCIMAAALSWNIPRNFSSCSSNNYEKYLNKRRPSCMLEKPDYRSVATPAVCGNGFLEQGEQCDCGTLKDCTNRCCNATTCSLTEGSQCAEGECCQDCKIAPRTTECRRKEDECDLAEYCNGESATCPEDNFAVNGLPCDEDKGYCFEGQCPQRDEQCVRLYGSGATPGQAFCYNQNTRGLYYAFCKRPSDNKYIPCQKADIYCGKLFCHGGQSNPNYGRLVHFSACKASFSDDYTKDYGQVDAGSKCGPGKVCRDSECVEVATAYRNANCSAKCSGHAVCNHRDECQCEPGWAPPSCTSEDESFHSLSSASIIGIVVGALLLLSGIVAGVVVCMRKKRKATKPVAVDASDRRFNTPSRAPPQPLAGTPKPRGPPPPPPPAGNRPKPTIPKYTSGRPALRPVPPPKV
ncbi:disintegrin and metalloproteinase domain-containing protein 28 [Brachionichthys hirsutus]|uniref:disintegrin and metalloproteinase domain-containing protein 28 n=1 Tax=Brachionichthys hirsutus TaxID=412623 RepID=UPI0036047133